MIKQMSLHAADSFCYTAGWHTAEIADDGIIEKEDRLASEAFLSTNLKNFVVKILRIKQTSPLENNPLYGIFHSVNVKGFYVALRTYNNLLLRTLGNDYYYKNYL